MTEASLELLNYGALGIVVLLLIGAVVYLATEIRKKDKQLLDLHSSSIKILGDLSAVINSINNSTSNIPKEVKEELNSDFELLAVKIENIKN